MSEGKTLQSRIIKTELIPWRKLQFLQQDNFKDLSPDAKSKLKMSLVTSNFVAPFFVWEDQQNQTLFCLDGRHRCLAMLELEKEGYDIPEMLPATFIRCESKEEAAKLVLTFSSLFAKINAEGLYEYLTTYGIDALDVADQIDLPAVDMESFLVRFQSEPGPDELIGEAKEKPPTLRITFADESQAQSAVDEIKTLLEKYPGSFYSVSAGEI